ncbi:regulator of chromosome condensation [Corallococcus macrosporus]|uniref:Regulator of chromosome condensation n=1 Tax=Myxococcus fulvus (strain ATCC BAA-855 / HW-1) TaxID=483219 RepID=F8CMD0_MYXFH|nr:regulator of chromosome condensation [Corallococcus macrosporus]
MAAGAYHSLFLKKNGEVWSWGQNTAGQLGTGSVSTTPQSQPAQVIGLPAIKAIAAGIAHSLALDTNGDVWAWGQNAAGQAGIGSTGGTVLQPQKVPALSGIQAIAANGSYSLALGEDGSLWAWGQNSSGQVGTGSTSVSVHTPAQVQGLPGIRAIAAGLNHVLALDTEGRVWGWGANTSGQTGRGSTSTTVLSPTQVAGLPPVRAIAAGAGHSLAVDEAFGNVWAWGQNNFGQTGTGATSTTPVLNPTAVGGIFAVTDIAAGHFFSLAIVGEGHAVAWGHNIFGQLGNGSTAASAIPVSVTGLGDARAVAAGAQHALSIRPGCPVWSWGNNGQGQLGTGSVSTAPTSTPLSSLIINTFYFDGDMDGFGDEYIAEQACEPSPGFVEELDCDDYSMTTFPGAPEMCNGMDENCDGTVDDGNPSGGDACSTGLLGVCATGTTACVEGAVACQQNQTASDELCDALDNDCDGEADEDNPEGLQECSTGQQGVCGEGVTYCTHGAVECVQKQGPAPEVCDGRDNDCNGELDEGVTLETWYRDADGDGFGDASQPAQGCVQPSGYVTNASDCNDGNAAIRPGAAETCDGLDNDCNGSVDEGVQSTWYRDADGDGFGNGAQPAQACAQPEGHVANANDCDDASAGVRPGASEVCDDVDNNCNGAVDEGLTFQAWYRDADGDGYGAPTQSTQACSQPGGYVSNASDCNDASASIRPGASEVCDGTDNNCDGAVDEGVGSTWYRDADSDGYGNPGQSTQACSQPGGYVANSTDCNDTTSGARPGGTESCDGVDNNCNGSIDEGVGSIWYRDADGDGNGNASQSTQACSQPSGYVANATDCNDASATIRPGAAEVCDGADNNCNGSIDEGLTFQAWYRDADGDGYGAPTQSTQACSQPGGYVSNASDCNDASASIRPGASEVCDGADNNCNGSIDEGVGSIWYRDADGDGNGNASQSTQACSQPSGYVANSTDCNDTTSGARPGGTESCDGVDNNCNGSIDEGVGSIWYRDADGDGNGNASQSTQACSQPSGYVANSTDCNDTTSGARPGGTESCDGVDNNCNGSIDEGVGSIWYRDADGDGNGNASQSTQACSQPSGYVANATDCNDASATIRPGAAEVCDGADNNCNGSIDEGVKSTWYRDADGDGYGSTSAGASTQACSKPSGYVANATDCNDTTSSVRPGGTEVCDGLDNNCNGSTDEGVSSTWYRDADGDGYGNPGLPTQACSKPSGYVANATDCNDTTSSVRPGGTEVCDGLDNNCNGSIDEGVKSTWYRDADGDGYGSTSAGASTQACSKPSGYVANATDCNDTTGSARPGGTEVCDGLDNNCNGSIDDGVGATWYRDADGDGYGNPNQHTRSCSKPGGYVSSSSDCNDASASIRPGAAEVCDGADNNCNGSIDEGVGSTWHRDADGDGFGHPSQTTQACSKPSGYVADSSDCADTQPSVNPGMIDLCHDLIDNNCDGVTDEYCGGPGGCHGWPSAQTDPTDSSTTSAEHCPIVIPNYLQ